MLQGARGSADALPETMKSLSGTGRCPRRLSEALPEAIRSYARGAGQSGRVDE